MTLSANPPAKPRRAPQARAQLTREKILLSARMIFQEQGFEDAKTSQIAHHAGVAEGSVFAHFGTKQGLLIGLMEDHYAVLINHVEALVAGQPNPQKQLSALIEFHLQSLLDTWSLVRLFAHFGRYDETPTAKVFRQLNRKYTAVFSSCINQVKLEGDIAPSLPADLVRDLIFGTAEHWAFRAKEFNQPLDLTSAATFLMGRITTVDPT